MEKGDTMEQLIKSTVVEFKSGKLLSKEMLEQMQSNSLISFNQYFNYADGILYGLDFYQQEDKLYLTQGALKKDGTIYISTEKLCVTDTLNDSGRLYGNHVALIFRKISDKAEAECVSSSCMKLMLVPVAEVLSETDIIMAKFQYQSPTPLWNSDNSTRNTLIEHLKEQRNREGYDYSFIDTPYSIPNETTFPPYIFSLMAELIQQKDSLSSVDFTLLSMIYQFKAVSLNVLSAYLKYYGVVCSATNRDTLIDGFLKTLNVTENIAEPVPHFEPKKEVIQCEIGL
jgi:hypothetical protein